MKKAPIPSVIAVHLFALVVAWLSPLYAHAHEHGMKNTTHTAHTTATQYPTAPFSLLIVGDTLTEPDKLLPNMMLYPELIDAFLTRYFQQTPYGLMTVVKADARYRDAIGMMAPVVEGTNRKASSTDAGVVIVDGSLRIGNSTPAETHHNDSNHSTDTSAAEQPLKPTIALIVLGLHDIVHGARTEDIYEDMLAVQQWLRARGIAMILAVNHLHIRGLAREFELREMYDAFYVETGVPYMQLLPSQSNDRVRFVREDEIHPNGIGHYIMARAFIDYVHPVMNAYYGKRLGLAFSDHAWVSILNAEQTLLP